MKRATYKFGKKIVEPSTPYINILMHQQQTANENIFGEEEIARKHCGKRRNCS